MKSSLKTLLVVAAFGTFTVTSCSEKKVEDAAAATETGIENSADSVKADIAREPGDTAVVRDVPADKVIEQVPATQK